MNAQFHGSQGASDAECSSSDHRSTDELDAAICALARNLNAETYRMLLLVREFEDRMGYAKWSFRNCAEWLAWRCGLSLTAAREKVRTARALRDMPAISAAFAEGRLSYSKVRALTRVVDWHNEDLLLEYALHVTAAQVEERCRHIRNAAPDASSVAQRAWERRSLALWRSEARGVMSIRIEVPIEEGELIAQALERAVAAGEAASGIEFLAAEAESVRDARDGATVQETMGNGWRAQQADALVAIAKAYLNGDASAEGEAPSGAAADRYQIIVHVDEAALRGSGGCSDLPIDTVKRLTCDGSTIRVVEDEAGTPLDVGRKQRVVSTMLKRALFARDRGCSFPGCHNKRYLDAHHIRHWADGGATSLENMTLLCSHHHRLLHEGGFSIRRDAEGRPYFQRPDGRAIPRFGYRFEDMRDESSPMPECAGLAEFAEFAALAGETSATRETSAVCATFTARDASAEVRERRGAYRVRCSA